MLNLNLNEGFVMRKILISLFAVLFASATANAEVRIGISGAYTMFETSGTETVKSSGTKNSKTHDDEAIVPSIFFEVAGDNGVAFGVDFIPVEAEVGSGKNVRTDTDTDDASDTAGNNNVSAELTSHTTLYLTKALDNGLYIKGGYAIATIDTTETLATGTKYGNEDVNGIMIGLGANRDNSNGTFFRTELTYTDYEDVSFQGTLDTDSVRNKIDADIDALAFRVSVGRAF
tara:strand:+ start:2386 stop:3078 length:693 start_codon:yes stop_codon:yes gene_type:complete